MKKTKHITLGLLALLVIGGASIILTSFKTDSKTSNMSPSYPSFGIDLPGEYDLHGIDVSRHQKEIDWEAVSKMKHKDVSVQFAFIKASEGRTVVDDYFKKNWKECKQAGIMRGAYHFYRPHLTADEQVKLFISMVPKLEKGDLAPVLDIEMYGSIHRGTLKKNLKRWLVLVEKHYGVTPIIYTNYGFYKHMLTGNEFKKYPLWIAHYKTPDLNEKLTTWDFWQHSDRGRVSGIRGSVDFNVFKGDFDDLKDLCKK
ncbi:MAG: glycoside hydrolase family 25 protein [Bacteroidia bacterium]|nr:glycoside hydrolase family 25 protein [Bacteroidia bacterium]MCC7533702.1 glycoside hydrolase family 25 protein [Bacteroidia bacterium]